tara:strand:- start:1851 stop:3263 length:1413 start_codon:yes stop_codon:yes gene_type:complete
LTLDNWLERRITPILAVVFTAWAVYMIYMKFRLLHYGLATDDLFNYANALYNTNFQDKWLFSARYELIRGLPSLLFNHWQPTLLILWPVVHLGGAEALLVVQALAPIWAAVFLLKIAEHLDIKPFDKLFVVIVCVFHPNLTAAIMDSLYGFHGTCLLLYFGAPLAWAAVTGRHGLAFVLLLLFLNIRENAALYVLGASAGWLLFTNPFFNNRSQIAIAAATAVAVFVGGLIIAPWLAGVVHEHAAHAKSVLTNPSLMVSALARMDSDWHNLFLWLWPGLVAPGTLLAMIPESIILILAEKKASHWYGMTLVFVGALAIVQGISRIRVFAERRGWGRALTAFLALHMVAIAIAGPKEVRGQTNKLVTRIGYHVPDESKSNARAAIDTSCRVAVELQAMYGFGDLPYLQYPRQALVSKYIVTIPKLPSGLTQMVNNRKADLWVIYEDEHLIVYENPSVPCVLSLDAYRKRAG